MEIEIKALAITDEARFDYQWLKSRYFPVDEWYTPDGRMPNDVRHHPLYDLDDYDWNLESEFEEPLIKYFPKKEIKADIEEYFRLFNITKDYFKLKWHDEQLDEMLYLFFRKGTKLGLMQFYDLVGICRFCDYDEELAEFGYIKNWLDTSIMPKDEPDWVIVEREKAEKRRKEMEEFWRVNGY